MIIISGRGNEALKEKYAEKIDKNVYGTQIINYWRITPINDGKGTHITHMVSAHIGGKILAPFKAKMAENQINTTSNMLEKIVAAINK